MLNYLKRLGRYWNQPGHAAYLFVLPSLLIIGVFTMVPLLSSFVVSTFDITTALTNARFVGFQNYAQMFADARFINASLITLKFTLLDVPAQVIFAVIIASMIPGKTFSNKALRSVYFLPIICSPTAIGIMWQIFMHPNVGWLPYVLSRLGAPKIAFFKDPSISLYSIIGVDVWRNFGITMTILVAAMQGIPASLYEAADIDGAGKARKFFSVTVPGIFDTLWFIVITRIIATLQVFDIVYTITRGGPAYSTETLVSYVYTRAFENTAQFGYSTAMAEALFLVILVITVVMYGIMNRQERERL